MALIFLGSATVRAKPLADLPDDLPPRTPAQHQVITELLRQPAGLSTIESLHLPESYLRRLADRIIQSSFEQQLRIVVRDEGLDPGASAVPSSSLKSPTTQPTAPDPRRRLLAWLPLGIGVVILLITAAILALRKGGKAA